MKTQSEWEAQKKWNLIGRLQKRQLLKKIGRGYQYSIIVWGKLPKQIQQDLLREYQRSCFILETKKQAA